MPSDLKMCTAVSVELRPELCSMISIFTRSNGATMDLEMTADIAPDIKYLPWLMAFRRAPAASSSCCRTP
eukprot:scaffold11297_cov37-Prasinocladus_malaysianus.AAC.1